MVVDIERTVNIYCNTVYHTIVNSLKDTPGLKVFHKDDISFSTNSPIQSTNDKKSRTRSIKVWRPTEIEKIQREYEKTYNLSKSIKTELSAIAKFCPYELIDYTWSTEGYQNFKVLKSYGLNIKPTVVPDNCRVSVEIDSSIFGADEMYVMKILMSLIKQIFYITKK